MDIAAISPIWVSEAEFADQLTTKLAALSVDPDFITGPGRSGAVAATYASYALNRTFVHFGAKPAGRTVLIVDTVSMSGRTLRRAVSKYARYGYDAHGLVAFEGDDRHHFWFEQMAQRLNRGDPHSPQGSL